MDIQSGLAHSAGVTAANVHDKRSLPDLRHGNERRVYGHSAYASQKEWIAGEAPRAKGFANEQVRNRGPAKNAAPADIYLARGRLMAQVRP